MKNRYDSYILENIPEQKKFNYKGWLNLSSNELFSPTIRNLYEEFLIGYDYQIHQYPFYQSATDKLARLYGVNTDQLVLTSGSNHAIFLLMHCFGRSVNKMILEWPNYESYYQYAGLNNIEIISVNFSKEPSFFLECVQAHRNCLVEITCPHGWSGYSFSHKDICKIAEICEMNNHILLIDEAYGVFAQLDYTDLVKRYENVFIIRSMSKSFGLASLRLGCVISTKENISYLKRWCPSNTISQYSCDVLSYFIDHYDQISLVQQKVIQNRDYLKKFLSEKNHRWRIWDTLSNFVVIQFDYKDDYSLFIEMMNNSRIKVKELTLENDYQNCVRMTVNENFDSRVLDILNRF